MRTIHSRKLKEETNQETWVILTRYNLATILYQLHKDFRFIILSKTIKTVQSQINFYYEYIIT